MRKTAQQLRDEALARVKARDETWFTKAYVTAAERLKSSRGERITGEHVRFMVVNRMERPQSPHVWGALVRELIKDGFLRPTRDWTPMVAYRSHARLTRLYLVC